MMALLIPTLVRYYLKAHHALARENSMSPQNYIVGPSL